MVNEGFPQSLPNVVDEGCPHIYVVVRLHHIYVIALQCTSIGTAPAHPATPRVLASCSCNEAHRSLPGTVLADLAAAGHWDLASLCCEWMSEHAGMRHWPSNRKVMPSRI